MAQIRGAHERLVIHELDLGTRRTITPSAEEFEVARGGSDFDADDSRVPMTELGLLVAGRHLFNEAKKVLIDCTLDTKTRRNSWVWIGGPVPAPTSTRPFWPGAFVSEGH